MKLERVDAGYEDGLSLRHRMELHIRYGTEEVTLERMEVCVCVGGEGWLRACLCVGVEI